MAEYTSKTKIYLKEVNLNDQSFHSFLLGNTWDQSHHPGDIVSFSGIYYCTVCGHEAACNKDDPFPPQNHKQHPKSCGDIQWKLVVKTNS